jgi:uracil phosphoribosyltransferase
MSATSSKLITDPSFEMLTNGKTPMGIQFAKAVYRHSEILARQYLSTQYGYYKEKLAGVIAIPRGGIPTAKATFSALADHETGDMIYVESRIKTEKNQKHILGDLLKLIQPQVVFITDGVIATGGSVVKHFSALADASPEKVIVLSNCTTEMGIEYLAEQAKRHGLPNFEQVTGRIFSEDECDWVEEDGKKVLFVGYNRASGLDLKLPDFGNAIQPRMR